MKTNDQEELERINKEIEEQLLFEMENKEENEKKRRRIYSFKGMIMLGFLVAALYRMLHFFF